jgi:hypothetical protein
MTSPCRALCLILLCSPVALCFAQNSPQPARPAAGVTPADTRPAPAMTQIRKSVMFIRLKCKDGGQEFDVRGTGFFVEYPDQRLPNGRVFTYLVTNRHVALCIDDNGHAMGVESISITLNRRGADGEDVSQEGFLNPLGNVRWYLPSDGSVDLAVLPLSPDPKQFDYLAVPFSMFAGGDLLKERRVAEGEPVFFAGFFYQFPGFTRMEPIVRRGIIAMMPKDKVPFVGNAERVYLADMHVFGGNSGSPAFINLGGLRENQLSTGSDYKLLGVVNANVSEDENFNLQLTTTIQGKAAANSGISTIVPADELKALLDDSELQSLRDEAVRNEVGAPK